MAAVEASASGLHWTFAPMIDIARDARWGRIVEGAGEDPYLGAVMAVAQVRGFQGASLSAPDTILATAKHFGAYGAAMGGRDYDTADISERTLREVYLPPFHAAVRAGAGSIMTAFNDIGGVPTTSNKRLLNGLLRQNWGFDGIILSDWNAIEELINHGVARNRSEAGVLALQASVDMDMTSGVFADDLLARVKDDAALIAQVNRAARRILEAKARLGLFEDPFAYHDERREADVILSKEHRASALDAALKSIVLLKNENNILPLSKSLRRIAVIGALATDASSPLGSWRRRGE